METHIRLICQKYFFITIRHVFLILKRGDLFFNTAAIYGEPKEINQQ